MSGAYAFSWLPSTMRTVKLTDDFVGNHYRSGRSNCQLADQDLENDTQAFVVRVWHEATDEEGHATTLRGSIDHVGSGKRMYFHDLNGIVRFIQEYLNLKSPPPFSRWKSWPNKMKRKRST